MTQAILQLQAIEKSFPGVKALNKASLNVYPGKVMALMGENGAGKSTLVKLLFRFYDPTQGCIKIDSTALYRDGRDLVGEPHQVRGRLGRVPR